MRLMVNLSAGCDGLLILPGDYLKHLLRSQGHNFVTGGIALTPAHFGEGAADSEADRRQLQAGLAIIKLTIVYTNR
jgi:hypothetical protein